MMRVLRSRAVIGFLVLAAAALWLNTPRLAPGAYNWAEPGNIAAALAEGRGFSDPFGGGTGATAWAPPVPVWIDAALFTALGVKSAAAAAAGVVLAVLGLSAAHALLVAVNPPEATWARGGTSLAFLALVILLPSAPLVVHSEAWINILLAAALLWSAMAHRQHPSRRSTLGLIATAAVAPLAHAGLAAATIVTLVALAWCDRRSGRSLRATLVAFLVAALALGAWTVRNAVTVGGFVPLKSNGWFELHLANVASSEGLVRAATTLRWMPYFSTVEFNRYASVGERAYVATFRDPTLAALRADPGHFLGNIGRRAANALLFCRRDGGDAYTRTPFRPADLARLTQAGMLLPITGSTPAAFWLNIDEAPASAHRLIKALGLEDFDAVWRDWAAKHQAYQAEAHGPAGLLAGFMIAGAPLLALLGLVLAGRGRIPPLAGWATLIAGAMLAPFILVNHGLRHQMPLLGLIALCFGTCAQAWIERMAGPKKSQP